MISSRRHVYMIIAVAVAASLLYFYFNPAYYSFFPKCIFHSITSFHCPGCGSQRAMHHLLHGDVAAAADHNLLMVLSLPFISLSGLVVANNIFRKKKLAQQVFYSPVFAWTVLAVVLLFFILRNVPLRPFSFLAP
jgi:hypothetical protein